MRLLNKFVENINTFKAIYIISLVGFITFVNCLFNRFVLDDYSFIVNNPEIHVFNIFALLGKNMFNGLGYYRPIPAIYFASLYSFFTTNQFFYHIVQITLHIANTFFVFVLFKKFFSEKLSLFLSLIFLVHPVQVESVSYIAGAGNPLFFLFGITALILSQKKISETKYQIWIYLCLFLSFLTKETGILFAFMITLYLYLFLRRRVFPFILYGIPVFLIYFFTRNVIGDTHFTYQKYIPIMTLSFLERLINVPQILFYYVKTFLFPLNLAVNQAWIVTTINFPNFFFPLILLIIFFSSLCVFGIYFYKKGEIEFKIFIFFFVWLVLGLLLHAQFVPLDFTVADRWFYFPIVGMLGVIGICFNEIKKYLKLPHRIVISCGVVMIALLMYRTVVRNNDWSDAFTLYKHDVQYTQSNLLENDLGVEYLSREQYDEAINHFKKSIAILPFEVNAYNLGLTYTKKHDDKNAKIYFQQAVQYYKGYVAHAVLAKLLLLYNDPQGCTVTHK